MKKLSVIGTGGHAKVVIATARAAGYSVVAAYDDNEVRHGGVVLGVPILGSAELASTAGLPTVIAIGANRARQMIAQLACDWLTVVHPAAVVHESVSIGRGSVVFAGTVVQPDSVLGNHVILNTGSSVDHDCRLGDWVHLGPGARLCGGVEIGRGTLVGVGASVIPSTRLGDWCTVGAGAAVARSFPDESLLLGVPARRSNYDKE